MRLFKKAAVCLLAAAMAVSMLTACGGDGPSNPGNGGNGGSTGGGNTSTSTPAKPDEGNSGNTSGGSEENGTTTTYPTSWNASKTKALFNKKGITDTNIYVSGTLNVVNGKTNQVTNTAQVVYAAKGDKVFLSFSDGEGTERIYKNEKDEYFANTGNGWYQCTTSDVIQNAKSEIAILQVLYKVPSNPYKFEAQSENGYYGEAVMTKWRTGADVAYVYLYTSDNQLTAISCAVNSGNNVHYMTCPIVLSANPNNNLFPNL